METGSLGYERITEGVWRIIANRSSQQTSSRSKTTRTESTKPRSTHLKAYAANNLIKSGLTIEEVMNALDISFSMNNQVKPPIVYQEATKIIFMRGNMSQIVSFDETIHALQESAHYRSIQNTHKKKESNPADEKTGQKNREKALENTKKQLSD